MIIWLGKYFSTINSEIWSISVLFLSSVWPYNLNNVHLDINEVLDTSTTASNVIVWPAMLMKLSLLNLSSGDHVATVDDDSYPSYSDSSDSKTFKLLVLLNVWACINLVLEYKLFGLWGHMIDILCLWSVPPQYLHFYQFELGWILLLPPFKKIQILYFCIPCYPTSRRP